MKNVNVKKRRSAQKGFTLVELAVVMIIVGLLIGGILKGQELITNAQVASVVTQVKAVDAGVSTFRDSYRALPGDMVNATTRLPNCSSSVECYNGGGNGIVNNAVDGSAAVAAASNNTAAESGNFFVHMALADVIGGVNSTGGTAGQFPETSLGGNLSIGHSSEGVASDIQGGSNFLSGHYVLLVSDVSSGASFANDGGPLNASQAARIDRKMDDGAPDTGSVRGSGGDCVQAGPPIIYDEQTAAAGCSMVFRVQG